MMTVDQITVAIEAAKVHVSIGFIKKQDIDVDKAINHFRLAIVSRPYQLLNHELTLTLKNLLHLNSVLFVLIGDPLDM